MRGVRREGGEIFVVGEFGGGIRVIGENRDMVGRGGLRDDKEEISVMKVLGWVISEFVGGIKE